MSDFDNTADVDTIDDNAGNRINGAISRAAVEYVVKSIVDDKEAVVVDIDDNGDAVTLQVHVADDDKGKIIGKRGRVAMSLRTVARAVGAREGTNVSVDIAD